VDRECHGRPVREHLNQRPVAQIICNQIARRIGDAGAGKRCGTQRLPIVDLDVAMDLDRERCATLVMERPAVMRDQVEVEDAARADEVFWRFRRAVCLKVA